MKYLDETAGKTMLMSLKYNIQKYFANTPGRT